MAMRQSRLVAPLVFLPIGLQWVYYVASGSTEGWRIHGIPFLAAAQCKFGDEYPSSIIVGEHQVELNAPLDRACEELAWVVRCFRWTTSQVVGKPFLVDEFGLITREELEITACAVQSRLRWNLWPSCPDLTAVNGDNRSVVIQDRKGTPLLRLLIDDVQRRVDHDNAVSRRAAWLRERGVSY